jgi:hypothetical protein
MLGGTEETRLTLMVTIDIYEGKCADAQRNNGNTMKEKYKAVCSFSATRQ